LKQSKTIIHINQHIIRKNKKAIGISPKDISPAITVKQGNSNFYGYQVDINGPSIVKYQPDKPLKCGAVAWIETNSEVIIDGKPLTEIIEELKS
jgi:hypothetical protein